jgi:hypothetical protein
MHRSAWGRTLIAIILGSALAAAIPVLPAVGQDSPPHPVVDIDTGRLVAKGAAVDVPVTYTCGPGDLVFGYLYVNLSQRTQQGRLAQGSGYTDDIVCDGTPHTVIVRVTLTPTLAAQLSRAAWPWPRPPWSSASRASPPRWSRCRRRSACAANYPQTVRGRDAATPSLPDLLDTG